MDTQPIIHTFETLINVGAAVAAMVAAFFVMLAGYQYMTAGVSVRALEAAGIETIRLPLSAGRPDPRALMAELARRDVMAVLVEGGAEVSASLLEAVLVDRLEFILAPKLIGGRSAPGPVGGPGLPRMADAVPLGNIRVRRLGTDLLVRGALGGGGGEEQSLGQVGVFAIAMLHSIS